MQERAPERLPRRLRLAFLMQVVIASVVDRRRCLRRADRHARRRRAHRCENEAAYYWGSAQRSARVAPSGDGLRRLRWFRSARRRPRSRGRCAACAPGLHIAAGHARCWSASTTTSRLYLTYPQARIEPHRVLNMVLAPVLLALLAVALSSWFTYRIARRWSRRCTGWRARSALGSARPRTSRARRRTSLGGGAGHRSRAAGGALQRHGRAHARLRRPRTRFHPRCQPRAAHAADRDPRGQRPACRASRTCRSAGTRSLRADAMRGARHGGGDRRVPDPGARKRNRAADARISASPTSSTRKSRRRVPLLGRQAGGARGRTRHVAAPACVAARARA